jgi:hypothetical protein
MADPLLDEITLRNIDPQEYPVFLRQPLEESIRRIDVIERERADHNLRAILQSDHLFHTKLLLERHVGIALPDCAALRTSVAVAPT